MSDTTLSIDCTSGEVAEVPLTVEEKAQRAADVAAADVEKAEQAAKVTAEDRLASIEKAITEAPDFAGMKAKLAADEKSSVKAEPPKR